jgi:hypothetical protein
MAVLWEEEEVKVKGPDLTVEIPTLWWEKPGGQRSIPTPEDLRELKLPGQDFCYQYSQFPTELKDTCIRIRPDGTSSRVMEGSRSWSPALVLAMARPTLWQRILQVFRLGGFQRRLELPKAILFAATACEGCLNVLGWQFAAGFGYPRNSTAHRACRTECELCVPREQ